MPNVRHQRCEPAAKAACNATDMNGWLASAEWRGWRSYHLPSERSVQCSDDPQRDRGESVLLVVLRNRCNLGVGSSLVFGPDMPISPDPFDHEFPPLESELGGDLIAPPKEASSLREDHTRAGLQMRRDRAPRHWLDPLVRWPWLCATESTSRNPMQPSW